MNQTNSSENLAIANKELAFQNGEREKRAAELIIADRELAFQNDEKEKRAAELIIANKELLFQNDEKEKRAAELIIANKELAYQNEEKEKRAAELAIANKELLFQNGEKEKRAEELIIANKELIFQNQEKGKRAEELIMANSELAVQNEVRKLTEEQIVFDRNNLHALINNTSDLMWSVDTSFKLITSNKPFDQMITSLSGEAIREGRSVLTSGFSSRQLLKFKLAYERAFSGDIFTDYEHTTMPVSRWSEISYCPIRNEGVIVGAACHSRDVTARKNAELANAAITEDLTNRNKDLEDFAHLVSHKLRAPLASILGATTILKDYDLTKADRMTLADGINDSAHGLDDVITELNQILKAP